MKKKEKKNIARQYQIFTNVSTIHTHTLKNKTPLIIKKKKLSLPVSSLTAPPLIGPLAVRKNSHVLHSTVDEKRAKILRHLASRIAIDNAISRSSPFTRHAQQGRSSMARDSSLPVDGREKERGLNPRLWSDWSSRDAGITNRRVSSYGRLKNPAGTRRNFLSIRDRFPRRAGVGRRFFHPPPNTASPVLSIPVSLHLYS